MLMRETTRAEKDGTWTDFDSPVFRDKVSQTHESAFNMLEHYNNVFDC